MLYDRFFLRHATGRSPERRLHQSPCFVCRLVVPCCRGVCCRLVAHIPCLFGWPRPHGPRWWQSSLQRHRCRPRPCFDQKARHFARHRQFGFHRWPVSRRCIGSTRFVQVWLGRRPLLCFGPPRIKSQLHVCYLAACGFLDPSARHPGRFLRVAAGFEIHSCRNGRHQELTPEACRARLLWLTDFGTPLRVLMLEALAAFD